MAIQYTTVDWAKGSNIYEVNIRQYTPEGSFLAFAKHLPRLKKMGVEIKLQDNKDAFKEIRIGSQVYKRYSQLALETLRKELPNMDMEKVWQKNRPKIKSAKVKATVA